MRTKRGVILFPLMKNVSNEQYIGCLFDAINRSEDYRVVNEPHKNPLISLFLPRNRTTDYYLFNWIENVPLYKHGYIQFCAAILLLIVAKIRRKKIIYILHNKRPHSKKRSILTSFIMNCYIKHSHRIITHASEGIDIISKITPRAVSKAVYLPHPLIDRLPYHDRGSEIQFDLLVWGGVTKYKGIVELLEWLSITNSPLRVKIIGNCTDTNYIEQIEANLTLSTFYENRAASFDQISSLIEVSRFVLIPYNVESILSSGILMDSLSMGASIIAPNVGAFRDCSQNSKLCVYCYDTLNEVSQIVDKHQYKEANHDSYRNFIEANSWDSVCKVLLA